jgi:hypothetical protein
MTVASVVASPVAGRLTTWLGARRTAAWGFAISGTGLVMVASIMPRHDVLAAVLFGMAVAETGFVTASLPLTVAATELGNALGWVAAVTSATTAASRGRLEGADALVGVLR